MDRTFDRRAAMQALALTGATLTVHDAVAQGVPANASPTNGAAPAFTGSTKLKPLPFDSAKLDGLSEKLIRSHWEYNYGGSVRTLAAVKKKLSEALAAPDTPAWLYNDLKREHLLRTGSVVLHELYFDNLGGNGRPGAAMRAQLGKSFGSYDAWETEFRRIAVGLGGGSGWVVLGFNTHLAQLENYWMADHSHGPASTLPLLVMDMYEHSYQMDFGAATDRYVDGFFRNLDWEAVAGRLEQARSRT
jgi:superoxide dismutase, Fe-Mn family